MRTVRNLRQFLTNLETLQEAFPDELQRERAIYPLLLATIEQLTPELMAIAIENAKRRMRLL
jgi:hypothetical protein